MKTISATLWKPLNIGAPTCKTLDGPKNSELMKALCAITAPTQRTRLGQYHMKHHSSQWNMKIMP